MAQNTNTSRNTSSMERVGKRKFGYNVSQVNEFLERAHKSYVSNDMELTQKDIQEVSFDLERNGYVISQVDAALSRLENAVVDKITEYDISHRGRVVWKAELEDIYRTLLKHAKRAERQRFAPGEDKRPSYDRTQVDELVNQILDKIAVSLGRAPSWDTEEDILDEIESEFVSDIVFTQRKGKHGYDERQVDYYLNACVRVLSKLESYDRISNDLDVNAADSYEGSNSEEKSDSEFGLSSLVKNSEDNSAESSEKNVSSLPSFAPTSSSANAEGTVEAALSASNLFGDSNAELDKENPVVSSSLSDLANGAVPEKQSIFAPVEHDSDDDNSDTDDDMIQSATVLSNVNKSSAPLPPAFPPAPKKSSSEPLVSEPLVSDSSNSDLNSNSEDHSSLNFEQSRSLNLDIPDLSFPIMNKLGSFDSSSDSDASDSDTSDSENN